MESPWMMSLSHRGSVMQLGLSWDLYVMNQLNWVVSWGSFQVRWGQPMTKGATGDTEMAEISFLFLFCAEINSLWASDAIYGIIDFWLWWSSLLQVIALRRHLKHYSDVIMNTMVSQITSVWIVYSTVCSDADQRKHQNSTSLAFVREIDRWLVNSLHKGPVTQKMFPFDDVIMSRHWYVWKYLQRWWYCLGLRLSVFSRLVSLQQCCCTGYSKISEKSENTG